VSPPNRPDLDDLLLPDLRWDPARNAYARSGAVQTTSAETRLAPRLSTTHTSHRPPAQSKDSQEALEFEARLRLAIEKGHFRVLDVTSGYDQPAAEELARRTGARLISLERDILLESERLMEEWGIESSVVFDADRTGPAQREEWEILRRLMKSAAERVLARILGANQAVILTQPGILARYQLDDVVGHLVEQTQGDEAPSLLLLNPTDDASAPATIDASTGPLVVPLTSQAQRLRVPESWIRNLHRGAL
jgi:hypothetical protein